MQEADSLAEIRSYADHNEEPPLQTVRGTEKLHGLLTALMEQGNRIGKRLHHRLMGSTKKVRGEHQA